MYERAPPQNGQIPEGLGWARGNSSSASPLRSFLTRTPARRFLNGLNQYLGRNLQFAM